MPIDLVKDLLPEPSADGRPEEHSRREIVNTILYLVRSGRPWQYLSADPPPWQTVYWYFVRWEEAGVTENLLTALRVKARVAQGRVPQPSAGVLDSHSVKGADTVGCDSRGYDAGKKINGRKRSIVTDTAGLLITACVLAAPWQDRDDGKTALLRLHPTPNPPHLHPHLTPSQKITEGGDPDGGAIGESGHQRHCAGPAVVDGDADRRWPPALDSRATWSVEPAGGWLARLHRTPIRHTERGIKQSPVWINVAIDGSLLKPAVARHWWAGGCAPFCQAGASASGPSHRPASAPA